MDNKSTVLALATRTFSATGLTAGSHSWKLQAVSGSWAGRPHVIATPAVSGTVTVRP